MADFTTSSDIDTFMQSANYVAMRGLLALGMPCNGRLTTESGVPVSISDRTAQTTIYFTPYLGNLLAIYSGTAWQVFAFSELSITLSSLTSGKNYDVFVYSNSGTPTLELSAAWTNDTTRADALVLQDGIYVKSGAGTRRYLGTIRTTSTTTTEDSTAKRFVWNQSNRAPSTLKNLTETADSWSYTTNTWRQANANTANQVEYVTGDPATNLSCTVVAAVNVVSNASRTAKVGIGVDSTTSPLGYIPQGYNNSGSAVLQYGMVAVYQGQPGLGYHKVCWIEKGADGTSTFLGDDGGNAQYGMYGMIDR